MTILQVSEMTHLVRVPSTSERYLRRDRKSPDNISAISEELFGTGTLSGFT